jgi:hypothetical protein
MNRCCYPPFRLFRTLSFLFAFALLPLRAAEPSRNLHDPREIEERTCFQTGSRYNDRINLRSDVAIVYGIDPGLPERIESWRAKGYRIHVMTGVSWGNYQDYLYGRFDGTNHEDEAQTDRAGKKISHGGDVYYMCPGENYGKFLCLGVDRALKAGAEAIHLEEPEFWVRGGYSEGFKREWKSYYGEDWQPPHSSVDSQWRASKLKYFLYRRALQQVFDHIQEFNRVEGRQVKCYVPTHSLVNYAHWRIVSPESSLAMLKGCDGYIAQVWTGTSRTPNVYQGLLQERTFETAFLEYGAMQNLVRSTGRRVWYLNDPVEDNPDHDWNDYQSNWESTLVASLFQPDVWQYEVMPWPDRIFPGHYPAQRGSKERVSIPPDYAAEIHTVINALNDMRQSKVTWQNATPGVGVVVSDSLMFQRGDPNPSDPHMSHLYGLALPLLKSGIPVTPVQLENVSLPSYLDGFRLLLMTYQGMKPLSSEVHNGIARWVKKGGTLVFADDDSDPYNQVREWWNTNQISFSSPRQHLFEKLGLQVDTKPGRYVVGRGELIFAAKNPVNFAKEKDGAKNLMALIRTSKAHRTLPDRPQNSLVLRRGPYVIAAGLAESPASGQRTLEGEYINLFDPKLSVRHQMELTGSSRLFLLDLKRLHASRLQVVASTCKTLLNTSTRNSAFLLVEGADQVPGTLVLRTPGRPAQVSLEDAPELTWDWDGEHKLSRIQFQNRPYRRELSIRF